MPIKIDFVSDVSQVTRDVSTLADRLDEAVDELRNVESAGEGAARGIDQAADAGRDLDRIGDGADDAARSLDDIGDSGKDAAKGLDTITDAGDDAARSLDDIADAGGDLDRVDRALDDTGDAAKKAGKEIENTGDDIEKMSKDAAKDVSVLDDKVKDAFDNMSKAARDNTSKIKQTTKQDLDEAGDATETFKDEARQNFSETMSSFDGSFESVVDGIQGTFGGVAADLGPKGMIGAGIAAAALGLGVAMAQKMAEGINEKGELAAELAKQINEAGGALDDVDFVARMDEWGGAIQNTREAWELWQGAAKTGFQEIRDLSDDAGLSYKEMFEGAAGSIDDSRAALEQVNEALEEHRWSMDAVKDPVAWNKQGDALLKLQGHIEDNIEVQEAAIDIEEGREDAIGQTTEGIMAQIDAHEELSDVLTGSVESELDYLDTLDEVNGKIAENGRTLDKNTTAGRDNIRALIDLKDSALDMASSQIEAGEATGTVRNQLQGQRNDFIAAAQAAGLTAGEARDLADAYGLVPDKIITDVRAKGTDEAKRKINDVADGPYEAVVATELRGYDLAGRRLDRLTRPRTATVTIRTVGAQSTYNYGRTRAQTAW